VLNPDQTVAARTVEITHDNGELTIVSAGLEAGQKVVTDGQARLQNGSHVTLIAAAPKPATDAPRAGG
jgi:multidrug efflux system membrane fusion protein